MKKFGGRLLWILVIAGAVYGVYYFYSNWWQTGNFQQSVGKTSEAVVQKAKTTLNQETTTIGSQVGNFLKDKTAGILKSASLGLATLADNISGVTSTPSSVMPPSVQIQGNLLSKPTGPDYSVPPPAAAIIARVNLPLVFAVNAGSNYKVDWGDGATSEGSLPSDKIQLLDHAWLKEGDYTVRFDIVESGTNYSYSFPIRVYPQ